VDCQTSFSDLNVADQARVPKLDERLLSKAILIRTVEKRLLELFAAGKLHGTVHTCIGQEWTGIVIAEALREGDAVLTGHRGHGHYLSRTDDVEGLVAELMGRQSGVCAGRGGSQHLHGGGVYSSGVQGGMAPVAAGLALARKYERTGNVVILFLGDGTLGEGVVYEALNIISKWQLPLLVVVEDNGYAQSTRKAEAVSGEVGARATAFGIDDFHADTWNIEHLLATAKACVKHVREEGRPALLHIETYRLAPHSKGDDNRDPAEVAGFRNIDVIERIKTDNPRLVERLQAVATSRVDQAVARAEASECAMPPLATNSPNMHYVRWLYTQIISPGRGVERIREGLARNIASNNRIVLLGEDIGGDYGGAFKVTAGLDALFPGRVLSTPISEAAIIGLGIGMALEGVISVCEIMFGDFLTLASDQLINHAAKFRYVYNNKVRVPLIVRTPMGGRRGYGATHSQSLEKHFLGIPDTRVLALHHRFDPAESLNLLFSTVDRPTLLIENKSIYACLISDKVPAGWVLEHSSSKFPTTRLRPLGSVDATILCYGGMLMHVEQAIETLFEEYELVCEVMCPMQLYPLDLAPILESVKQTGRLLIVEEGSGYAGFGSEVVAQLAEVSPTALKRLRRISGPMHPIPAAKTLEAAVLPSSSHVVDAVREVCRDG